MVIREIQFSIKISYMNNSTLCVDNVTLFYYFKPSLTTKNMFILLSEKIKEQLNLDSDKYHFILYDDSYRNLQPYNTQSCLTIYNEFNGQSIVPFYIHILNINNYNNMINEQINERPECPVCYATLDRNLFITPFTCGHRICHTCFNICLRSNINNCCYC